METTAPQWQTTIFGMLTHPTEPCILLWSTDNGYILPSFVVSFWGMWLDPGVVKQQMQRTLGTEVNILRRAYYHERSDQYRAESIYILEAVSPLASPNGRWIDRAALSQLKLAYPAHRQIMDAHFTEIEGGSIPAQRPPWAQPGWHATALTWITEQLDQLGYGGIVAVEPVRSWSLSCVLRVRTVRGEDVYFKAAPDSPLFINEGVVMTALATYYPQLIPRPLRIEAERKWILLADFRGRIAYEASVDERTALLHSYGPLQVDTTQHIDALLKFGCRDRRLSWLVSQIDPLIQDSAALQSLTDTEVAQLQQLAPQLKQRCLELEQYRVPPALVHGDLNSGNAVFRDDGVLFFDWTEACISHPFLDMIDIYGESDMAIQQRLRDQYLSHWITYEPMTRLQELWAMTKPIFALHQAVSYRHIYASIEPATRHELAWGVPRWVRMLLQSMG